MVEYSEANIGSVPPAAPIVKVPLVTAVDAEVEKVVAVIAVIVVPTGNPPPITVSPTDNPVVVAVTVVPDIVAARVLVITALFNDPLASTITQLLPVAPGVVVKVKPLKLEADCACAAVNPVTPLVVAIPLTPYKVGLEVIFQ